MRFCATPSCKHLVEHGHCVEHARAKRIVERRHHTVPGVNYGRPWKRIRDAHIAKHPWCVECLKAGTRMLANEVDHIVPHEGDPTKFYDVTNLQSLCKPHHSAKTAAEVGFVRRI